MPWETAGEVTANRKGDLLDEAEELKNDLPPEFRVIEDYSEGRVKVEHEVEGGDRWVSVAEITHPNAAHEWAEELADGISGEYRVVFDYTKDEYNLEARVND